MYLRPMVGLGLVAGRSWGEGEHGGGAVQEMRTLQETHGPGGRWPLTGLRRHATQADRPRLKRAALTRPSATTSPSGCAAAQSLRRERRRQRLALKTMPFAHASQRGRAHTAITRLSCTAKHPQSRQGAFFISFFFLRTAKQAGYPKLTLEDVQHHEDGGTQALGRLQHRQRMDSGCGYRRGQQGVCCWVCAHKPSSARAATPQPRFPCATKQGIAWPMAASQPYGDTTTRNM